MSEPVPLSGRPQRLKLTLRDGQEFELRNAHVVGDSIIGEAGQWSMPVRRAAAIRDIQKLADRQLSAGNSVGAFFGVLGVVTIAGLVMASDLDASMRCMLGCP
jgi:hypothetical protein